MVAGVQQQRARARSGDKPAFKLANKTSMNLDGLMDSESETDEEVVGRNRRRRKHTNPASVIFYSDSEVSDGSSRSPSPRRTGVKTNMIQTMKPWRLSG